MREAVIVAIAGALLCFLLSPAAREREQRAEVDPMREQHKSEGPMKPRAKFVTAALLLIGGASTASAQSYWYNGDYALKQRGYYGTPYDGGPQYGSGGGDQYGYGPAYSYGKQAPAPPPCIWRRVWNGHYWVRSCVWTQSDDARRFPPPWSVEEGARVLTGLQPL
jgi:hypothetical protein